MSNEFDGSTHGRLTALPGHRLRFTKDTRCVGGGFERPGGGIYHWVVNVRRLTIRLVSEGRCGRTQTLTYPVWNRR